LDAAASPAAPSTLPPLATFVAAARDRSPAAIEARARLAQREVEREESLLALFPSLSTTASYTRRSAAARAEVLRATTTKSVTDAEAALADSWSDVLFRWESAKAARAEAKTSAAALEEARRLYVASRVTQIEVVTAARDALQAEVDRIQADANLELARALYALARGERQERSR
jgi:outer membrane protein TolC